MSINKLRPLPPFKLQVLTNFPFIDADFEALTNWELYAKLVDYLNKVIVPSENEVINAFNDLKDYVDNFLDNLNIQEEVNNKLDEMALDGTLENLLTPIVNGILTDEKLASIVYDIWGEDWNNLATKSYVDEKVAKYGIMPIASVDNLGKIVQYIGVSDSSYTRGYFYECVSDGAITPTYSWSEISFNGSSTSSTDLYYMDNDVIIDYNNGQYASINKLIPIINEVRNANKTSFIINVRTTYASQVRGILVANIIHNTSDDTYTLSIYPRTNNNYGSYKYINNSTLFNSISSNLTLVNDEVTALSSFVESYSSDLGFLPVNNTESYNVTSDYIPAHKKYVDDNVLKFDSMPTASNDYLGKVVQFIGTTNSSYTKGHFYECVDNGDTTYSWSEINFGGSSISSLPIYNLTISSTTYINISYNGSLTSDTQSELVNIINDMRTNNYEDAIIYASNSSSPSSTRYPFHIAKNVYSSYVISEIYTSNSSSANDILAYRGANNNTNYIEFDVVIVDNIVTSLSNITFTTNGNNVFLTPDNSYSYNVTGNYNPAHKKYVDDNVLKFNSMPTASNDYLGKVVQYIGTTDSSYTKGHFYECVSDGASTPTYSWSEISFGGGSSASFPIYNLSDDYVNIGGQSVSSNFLSHLEVVANDMEHNSFKNAIIYIKSTPYSNYAQPYNLSVDTTNSRIAIDPIITTNVYDTTTTDYIKIGNTYNYNKIYIAYTINAHVITLGAITYYHSLTNFLTTNNSQSYSVLNDYNPAHKKYVDENVLKFATMPTASNSYLGKVVQFIGTTDSTYTKGHFYECVSDGGTPATYSWSEISFGGNVDSNLIPFKKFNFNGNLYEATTLGSGYTIIRTAETQMTEFNNVIIPLLNNQIDNNIKTCNYLYCDSSGNLKLGNTYIQFTIPDNITTGTMNIRIYVFLDVYNISNDSTYSTWLNNYNRIIETSRIYTFTFDANNHITNIAYGSNYTQGVVLGLTQTNTRIYSVNGDYIPAHKKYVDDLPTTYTGYDATKTQVLKNINGTLTWVDET